MAEILKLDDARQIDLDRDMVEQAYDRWAPIYDLVFGGVFRKGRKAAIAATNKMGGRVLEVGIGTGISLPQYGPHLRILRLGRRRVVVRLLPRSHSLLKEIEVALGRYAVIFGDGRVFGESGFRLG